MTDDPSLICDVHQSLMNPSTQDWPHVPPELHAHWAFTIRPVSRRKIVVCKHGNNSEMHTVLDLVLGSTKHVSCVLTDTQQVRTCVRFNTIPNCVYWMQIRQRLLREIMLCSVSLQTIQPNAQHNDIIITGATRYTYPNISQSMISVVKSISANTGRVYPCLSGAIFDQCQQCQIRLIQKHSVLSLLHNIVKYEHVGHSLCIL